MGLSAGIIKRLLQKHGYLISKRHLRCLRHEFGVGALAEEADILSICSAITVKFSLTLQLILLYHSEGVAMPDYGNFLGWLICCVSKGI